MRLRFSVTLFPTVVEAGIYRHNRMTDDDEWLSDRERFNRLCLCCFSRRHRGEGDRFTAPITPVSGHQLIPNHKFLDYISILGARPTLPSRRDTAVFLPPSQAGLLWERDVQILEGAYELLIFLFQNGFSNDQTGSSFNVFIRR